MGTWLDKEELRLSELYDRHGNDYSKIAEMLTDEFGRKFTYHGTRNKIRRSSIIEYIADKKGEGIFEGLKENDEFNSYVEAKDDIKATKKYIENKYGSEVSIAVINDLHIPKLNYDVLEKFLLTNQNCDVLVIAGDYVDYKSISTYGNVREVSVEKEYKIGFEVMKRLSNMFKDVVVINGNHESRLVRYFSSKIVSALSGYINNKHKPLEEITRFFENVHYINHWFCHLYDVVFAHPSRYSKIALRTARNVVDDRLEKGHESEFGKFSTVVCGHSHRLGRTEFKQKIAIENGCFENKDVGYANKDAKGKNWVYGGSRIDIKNGKTEWNNIDLQRFD